MFVWRSTYNRLERNMRVLQEYHKKLNNDFNDMQDILWRRNSLLNIFDPETLQKELDNITINDMIKLCHPDKHQNNELSNKITSMLLEIRNED